MSKCFCNLGFCPPHRRASRAVCIAGSRASRVLDCPPRGVPVNRRGKVSVPPSRQAFAQRGLCSIPRVTSQFRPSFTGACTWVSRFSFRSTSPMGFAIGAEILEILFVFYFCGGLGSFSNLYLGKLFGIFIRVKRLHLEKP